MTPQAAVQRGSRQARDRRLERIEAIVQRQERVPAKGNDDGLFLDRQHRGFYIRGAGGMIADRTALLPLGHGLLVDAVASGKHPQARLTILYCSTDRLCRRGAAMKNLSHSASFQPKDKIAPSNAGTKHESRGSRPVLGGRGGAIPPRYSTISMPTTACPRPARRSAAILTSTITAGLI